MLKDKIKKKTKKIGCWKFKLKLKKPSKKKKSA
jgi:hypothetical protein